MTTLEALNRIHAPKGIASILEGVKSGDYSVLPHEKGIGADLQTAAEKVALHEQQLKDCKSDWSYWSILGDLEYWKAVRNILEAGKLCNDNLPEVAAPDMKGLVVMDAIGRVSDFGEAVLREAKRTVNAQSK